MCKEGSEGQGGRPPTTITKAAPLTTCSIDKDLPDLFPSVFFQMTSVKAASAFAGTGELWTSGGPSAALHLAVRASSSKPIPCGLQCGVWRNRPLVNLGNWCSTSDRQHRETFGLHRHKNGVLNLSFKDVP